jgi:hypothetical protein
MAKRKKLLIALCLMLTIGCTTTRQAYLPHTSRIFHAKQNCIGCNDPNPIVFQSVQHANSNGGIAPCSICIKTNQSPSTLTSGSGSSNTQGALPTGQSTSKKSFWVKTLYTLGVVALVCAIVAAGAYSSGPGYSTPSTSYSTYKSYNYDVSGYSNNGEYVWGDVDVDQSGGGGYIYDGNGDSVYIDVDWTGKGELEGYGSGGTYYELEVN